MRFRSTACVLGGILLAGHRAGLADSQSAGLSIHVVVTRSCSITTPPAGSVAVNCSRGPIPAIQSSAAVQAAAVTPFAAGPPGAATMSVTPQQRLSMVPSVASRAVSAAAPQAQPAAADGTTDNLSGSLANGGAADIVRSAPLQEILTINF
jgi:hypothetical protein